MNENFKEFTLLNKMIGTLSLLSLVACRDTKSVVSSGADSSDAAKICAGQTVAGISGTANCSGSVAEGFYVMSSRADNSELDFNALVDELWAGANPKATRSVATFKDAQEGSLLYVNNYSVIPRPLAESDGRGADGVPEKRHYLETIVSQATETSRADIQACGASGNIETRIADCRTKNKEWSFYSGAQYGQVGEGDWSQVSVVDNGGTKYEVWRDERTKLLWSDKAANDYNWFQAAGYSKDATLSQAETGWDASPGGSYQPSEPISACADVVDGKIAAGGGTDGYTYQNPGSAIKGNLSIADNVIWKLPSMDDWQLANLNGIRKVLPGMNTLFWSSSFLSISRTYAWYFSGDGGYLGSSNRNDENSVRCVGLVVD